MASERRFIWLVLLTATFMCVPQAILADTIWTFQQKDCWAYENTSGNTCIIPVTNTSNTTLFVPSLQTIYHGTQIVSGESDDKADDITIVAPTPTNSSKDVVQVASNGTFNIKFTWDAIDTVIDGDNDIGVWTPFIDFTYYDPLTSSSEEAKTFVIDQYKIEVRDTPEPSTLLMLGTGLLGLGGGLKRKFFS